MHTFDWADSFTTQLHAGNRFVSKEEGFRVDMMWDQEGGYDASRYELCPLIKSGMTFHYEYDFGDG